MEVYQIYLIIIAIVSIITFFLYATDKVKAMNDGWRIPEKVLLGFSLFGGAIGGYLAMNIVRHKTKHWYFHVVNIVGITLHIGILVLLCLI